MLSTSPFDLTGKVALITGASRGIGRAMAETYARAGARVVLSSRRQESLDEVVQSFRAAGLEATAVAAHTGDDEAIQALVERVRSIYGGIDILVNNAATNPHFGPLLTSENSHGQKTFDVNVMGYFRTARACHASMRSRGGGKIINVASVAGRRPFPGMGIYCVTKAAVLMLTAVLAIELAEDNIQVNAIVPGFVRTRFSQAIWDDPQRADALRRATPARRLAAPEELGPLALLLASPASDFITGAAYVVDGGLLVNPPATI